MGSVIAHLGAANKPKLKWGQQITLCKANQLKIGQAYFAFAQDHDGNFPVVPGMAAVGGQLGDGQVRDKPMPALVAKLYGAKVPVKERPLNKYVGHINCFHCPADQGGGAYAVPSCWKSLGNSYQAQVGDDMFRVRHVAGLSTEPKGSDEAQPITLKEIAKSPKNKILQGCWNWPYDGEDAWHGVWGMGQHVMLFGDGHAELYLFPETTTMKKWLEKPVPDPKFRWW